MSDNITLKAPTVNQDVNITINGEEKLKSLADTLDKISKNTGVQKYWKTQSELIKNVTSAYENFIKKTSKDNAGELIKNVNALKAVSKTDLSKSLPNFDNITKGFEKAKTIASDIDGMFSVNTFKSVFNDLTSLKNMGVDMQQLLGHFNISTDTSELQNNVRLLQKEVGNLTSKLGSAKNKYAELSDEFENFKSGSGFSEKLEELDRLQEKLKEVRREAKEEFSQFLDINNIYTYGWDGEPRFQEYFDKIKSGSLTAKEAIREFKVEYDYLLEDNSRLKNNSFGIEQLQTFSKKLESIFIQVQETSTKINDIISNGVITKSVYNLSNDSSLTFSQRSLFGNLLEDEESLKSITSLVHKLIEETNKASNTQLFDTEQFTKITSLFETIENHLSSLRKVISDVGDGDEFSPLLSTIEKVNASVTELSNNVKNIKLDTSLNLDLGSNNSLDKQLETKNANILSAYESLFKQLNMNSSGALNQQINEFLNGFDNKKSVAEQNALYANFLKQIRNQAKEWYGSDNSVKGWADKKYWNAVSGAKAALTKTEKSASSANDELKNIFGGTETDLTGVISKLESIAEKLDAIASSAKSMGEAFSSGLNVSASLEKITKLTDRVKELETELQKVKSVGGISGDKTDLSSGGTVGGKKNRYANAKRVSEDEYNQNYKKYADSANKYIKSLNAEILGGSVDVKFVDGLAQVNAKIKEADGSWKSFSAKVDADGNIMGQRMKAVTKDVNQLEAELKNFGKDTPKIFDASKQKEWLNSFNVLKEFQKKNSELNNLYANNTNRKNDFAIQELRKEIESLEPAAEKARQTIQNLGTSAESLDKIGISAKQGAEAIDLMDNAAKGSSKSIVSAVTTYEKFLNSANTDLAKFQKQKPMSNTFSDNVTKLEGEITKYSNLLTQVKANGGIATKEENENLNKYRDTISKLTTEIKEMSAAEKGAKQPGLSKIFKEINELRYKYSGMGKEFKRELNAIEFQFKKAGDSLNLADAKKQLVNFEAQLIRTGNNSKSLFDVIKNKAFYGLAGQIANMVSLYDVINVIKQAASEVVQLNTDITDLAKVSEQSVKQIYSDFSSYADIAKEMGGTISDTISATTAWAKNGYNIPDSKELARVSLLYKNVGDDITIDEANESLVSTLQGYKLAASDAEHIIDVFNEVSNNEAISSAGIGEALQRSAASFNAANTSLEQSVALVTATRHTKLVEYVETYIKNIFNCHRSLYYHAPQYRGNYYMMV